MSGSHGKGSWDSGLQTAASLSGLIWGDPIYIKGRQWNRSTVITTEKGSLPAPPLLLSPIKRSEFGSEFRCCSNWISVWGLWGSLGFQAHSGCFRSQVLVAGRLEFPFLASCQPRAAVRIQRLHVFLATWVPLSLKPAMQNLPHLESFSGFVSLSSLDLDLIFLI